MRVDTKRRKNARRGFEQIIGKRAMVDRMYQIVSQGKQGLDAFLLELGRMMAEAVMYMDREEIAGPDYYPKDRAIQKWASQPGSIYSRPKDCGRASPVAGAKSRDCVAELSKAEGAQRVFRRAFGQNTARSFLPEVC